MLYSAGAAAAVKFHTVRREQRIPRPVEEVFAFFADARNLAELTPSRLALETLTPGPIVMAAGTRIQYRLSVRHLPVRWTTEIRRWDPPSRFIDVQVSGPYALWHHTHRFEARADGTQMIDVVRYRLPFGMLGRWLNGLVVRRDVERIFDYRSRRIAGIFR